MMERTALNSERRKFKRVKVTFSIRYKVNQPLYVCMRVANQDINAIMLDLSEMGMSISTNYNIPAGTVLSIKFTLINDAAVNDEDSIYSMQIEGKVCNSSLIDEQEYRLGIRFTIIPNEARLKIAKFVSMI